MKYFAKMLKKLTVTNYIVEMKELGFWWIQRLEKNKG